MRSALTDSHKFNDFETAIIGRSANNGFRQLIWTRTLQGRAAFLTIIRAQTRIICRIVPTVFQMN